MTWVCLLWVLCPVLGEATVSGTKVFILESYAVGGEKISLKDS